MANTYLPLKEALDPIAARFFSWLPEPISKRLPERLNRDEVRTPMQWDGTVHAGFCPPTAMPWLPVNADHRIRNVASQDGRPWSLLELHRCLLHLRRDHAALHAGSLRLRPDAAPGVVAYDRIAGDDRVAIAANLGPDEVVVPIDGEPILLVATAEDVTITAGGVRLPADRAAVLAIQKVP